MEEQGTHKPLVASSNLALGTPTRLPRRVDFRIIQLQIKTFTGKETITLVFETGYQIHLLDQLIKYSGTPEILLALSRSNKLYL